MFTPEVTEAIPIALEQIFDSLQMSIMTEIVRMLLEAAEIIPSTGYKMNRLYDLGTSKKRIKDIVARTLNLSDKEVENIFTNITGRRALLLNKARSLYHIQKTSHYSNL